MEITWSHEAPEFGIVRDSEGVKRGEISANGDGWVLDPGPHSPVKSFDTVEAAMLWLEETL